jgi:hypothetical protein
MAVLTAALLLGNASSLVPRFIPGADAQAFVTDQSARAMQGQMSFLIKSFCFIDVMMSSGVSASPLRLGERGGVGAGHGGSSDRRVGRDGRDSRPRLSWRGA